MILVFPVFLLAQEEEEEEENPHAEMVDDEFVCLDCHTEVPKEGMTSPTYFLVDAPSENCLGCHDETTHPGSELHLGEEAKPLPGDENDGIACFTCHDPHPEGVIKGRTVYDAELTEREMKFIRLIVSPSLKEELKTDVEIEAKKEVLLREPFGKACITCHENVKFRGSYIPWYKFTDMYTY
ncbi:MAG: hypothetical protein RIG61_04495 [Deltaproteobacteria bacterium]